MVHDEDEYGVRVIGRGVDIYAMGDELASMTNELQVSGSECLVDNVTKL